jgi:hypothetical protein
MEYSREEQIENVFVKRPHVVILGAGASMAAVPQDRNGKALPDMRQLALLDPVRRLLLEARFEQPDAGFEAAYSALRASGEQDQLADAIDDAVRDYFADVEIPDEATIYDHLLMGLRPKDLIATFNWDPLIVQAEMRLRLAGLRQLPQMVFLHGNVAIAVCLEHKKAGLRGDACPVCHGGMEPVPLLYPVTEKNYEANGFIAHAWDRLAWGLRNAVMVTIFGYSAPVSDRAAIERFQTAWGTADEREFEQFELIGRPGTEPDQLRARWDGFIHTHHYDAFDDYFKSSLAMCPRRTGEVYFKQYIEANFVDVNPVPQQPELEATISFYRQLIAHEPSA